jgi:23S rRNA (pseudouridine1915-N3)-methyltransferase
VSLRVLALGTRMPAWVDEGFREYAKRMPREWAVELVELKPERRDGRSPSQILALEANRIAAAWSGDTWRAVLDERGKSLSTRELAGTLDSARRRASRLSFVIGSADGIAPEIKSGADLLLSLSALTLPHGLVRVILAEQLYRAVSLLQGHPYHRE